MEEIVKIGLMSVAGALLMVSVTAHAQESPPLQVQPGQSNRAQSGDVRKRCKPWRAIAAQLDARYNEAPFGAGVQSNGNLLQLYVSEMTGTWSLVVVRPSGIGCLVSAGKGWQMIVTDEEDPQA